MASIWFHDGRVRTRYATSDVDLGTGAIQSVAAGEKFIDWNLKSTATSGTTRGQYLRLYLTAGAGGEALRAVCQHMGLTAADTVNGAHLSLMFGAATAAAAGTAGQITGEGNAVRATLHIPGGRTLGGTVAAVKAELWADAATAIGSNMSFLRCTYGGTAGTSAGGATGTGGIEDTAYLISIDGGTNDTGNLVSAVGNEPTWASATHKIRCKVNGTVMYLVAVLA